MISPKDFGPRCSTCGEISWVTTRWPNAEIVTHHRCIIDKLAEMWPCDPSGLEGFAHGAAAMAGMFLMGLAIQQRYVDPCSYCWGTGDAGVDLR